MNLIQFHYLPNFHLRFGVPHPNWTEQLDGCWLGYRRLWNLHKIFISHNIFNTIWKECFFSWITIRLFLKHLVILFLASFYRCLSEVPKGVLFNACASKVFIRKVSLLYQPASPRKRNRVRLTLFFIINNFINFSVIWEKSKRKSTWQYWNIVLKCDGLVKQLSHI